MPRRPKSRIVGTRPIGMGRSYSRFYRVSRTGQVTGATNKAFRRLRIWRMN